MLTNTLSRCSALASGTSSASGIENSSITSRNRPNMPMKPAGWRANARKRAPDPAQAGDAPECCGSG